eukprot:4758901-Pyramimonas_sp.AAC.1
MQPRVHPFVITHIVSSTLLRLQSILCPTKQHLYHPTYKINCPTIVVYFRRNVPGPLGAGGLMCRVPTPTCGSSPRLGCHRAVP